MDRGNDSTPPNSNPQLDRLTNHITVNRYGATRYWAVWVNGELLAVTVYKKGALAIQDKLSSMASGV